MLLLLFHLAEEKSGIWRFFCFSVFHNQELRKPGYDLRWSKSNICVFSCSTIGMKLKLWWTTRPVTCKILCNRLTSYDFTNQSLKSRLVLRRTDGRSTVKFHLHLETKQCSIRLFHWNCVFLIFIGHMGRSCRD